MLSFEQVTYETKIWQHKKTRAKRKSARDLKNLHILPESSAEGLGSRTEHCWGYISIYENTPKKLPHLPPCYPINCGEVRTYASHKTTRTWENFNNRGTRILLSDKLWSIVITSKSFSNESKSVIKNNLGLCKRSEIYLRTLKNSHGSNGMKI